jgi:hypothetical protein
MGCGGARRDITDHTLNLVLGARDSARIPSTFEPIGHARRRQPRDPQKLKRVEVPEGDRTYLVHIGLTMLSAVGGTFDEDDTVFADIFAIDDQDIGLAYVNNHLKPSHPRENLEFGYTPGEWPFDELKGNLKLEGVGGLGGGVWGEDFGELPYQDSAKNYKTMRISSWVGTIHSSITFRLFVDGDDWVGASYFVLQL